MKLSIKTSFPKKMSEIFIDCSYKGIMGSYGCGEMYIDGYRKYFYNLRFTFRINRIAALC